MERRAEGREGMSVRERERRRPRKGNGGRKEQTNRWGPPTNGRERERGVCKDSWIDWTESLGRSS